jgi:hypothetical protein
VAKSGLTCEDKIKNYEEELMGVSFAYFKAKNKAQQYTKSKGV